jgi:hypothetical protein
MQDRSFNFIAATSYSEADGEYDFLTESCILSPLERLENPRGQRFLPCVRYSQTPQTPKLSLEFSASIAVLGSQSRGRDSSSQTSTRAGSTHISVWKYTGRCYGVEHPRGGFPRTRDSRLKLAVCAGSFLVQSAIFTFNRTLLHT